MWSYRDKVLETQVVEEITRNRRKILCVLKSIELNYSVISNTLDTF